MKFFILATNAFESMPSHDANEKQMEDLVDLSHVSVHYFRSWTISSKYIATVYYNMQVQYARPYYYYARAASTASFHIYIYRLIGFAGSASSRNWICHSHKTPIMIIISAERASDLALPTHVAAAATIPLAIGIRQTFVLPGPADLMRLHLPSHCVHYCFGKRSPGHPPHRPPDHDPKADDNPTIR